MALLEVNNLKTYYYLKAGAVKAADDVTFSVEKGESFGLAGESGCGKSTAAYSILRMPPYPGRIVGGEILYDGKDLVKVSDGYMRKQVRWKKISMIFQGAMNALNPVFKVGDQIAEAITLHERRVKKEELNDRVAKLLEMVGIDSKRIEDYPHEFSGGMKQRAMIAMSLANDPELVIADEPITALDVVVQGHIMELLNSLKKKLNLSYILITHDLSVVAETCDRVAIMYAGKIAEIADVTTIFKNPAHPYTQGLIGAFPSLVGEKKRLAGIPGAPPDLINPPAGCLFNPRCPFVMDICRKEEPPEIEIKPGHTAACWLHSDRVKKARKTRK